MKVSSCPACSAPVSPKLDQCPYCLNYLIHDGAPTESPTPPVSPEIGQQTSPTPQKPTTPQTRDSAGETQPSGVLFQRLAEPNENAFTIAVPKGWQLEGGIHRADLMHHVVDAQSIEAKLDLSVKSDSSGRVMIRWCPEYKFCDMRMNPAAMMFPPGSNYAGMIVQPMMSAVDFIIHSVLPWAHPNTQDVQVIEQGNQPLLEEAYQQRMAALGFPARFSYDGGSVTFSYTENGVHYHEKAQVVIENMGPIAGGMWSNKDTILLRAPQDEFEIWEPVLHHIQESLQLNFSWLAQEMVNQEFLAKSFLNAQQAQQARERRFLELQQQIQQMDRQIAEHRMRTNAEIMNDNYLTLMELEEYVNPITNEVETGSNQWDYRWVNAEGDEFYTDNEYHDPNIPGLLNCSDWQRTPVRPRFPQ
jgi:hypothetical protein